MDEGIGAVIGMTRATIQQGTRFINVGAMHPNPVMAKDMADMLANTYILQAMAARNTMASLSIENLEQEAAKASAKLSESGKALQDYVKARNMGSLVGSNDTIISELKSKNAELSEARVQRIGLDADEENIHKHLNDPAALLAIPSIANYPTSWRQSTRSKTSRRRSTY